MDNEINSAAKTELATNTSHVSEPNSNFIEPTSNIVKPNFNIVGSSEVVEPNSNIVGSNSYKIEPSITDNRLVINKFDIVNNDFNDSKLPTSVGMDVTMADIERDNKSIDKVSDDPHLNTNGNSTRGMDQTIPGLNEGINEVEPIEVTEEVLVKTKATGKTGEDDLLIEEWKKYEAKEGNNVNKEIGLSNVDKDSEGNIENLLFDEIIASADVPKGKNKMDDVDTKMMEDMLDDWADYGKKEINVNEPVRTDEESKIVAEKQNVVKSSLMGETIEDFTAAEAKENLNIKKEEATIVREGKEEATSEVKKRKLSSKKATKDKIPAKEQPGKASKPTSDDPKAEERRQKIEERMKKREEKLTKEKSDMKKHQQQLASAMKRLMPEEANDSGVDENTQSKETSELHPLKNGKISQVKKRQPRSVDPSPMKPRNPQSAASLERNIPMNKVEVGKTASPNIKNVRSKIGSLNNSTYKPGGGNVKIESKKLDFSKASSRIAAKNDTYSPGGGDKKIESQKLKWNANSKVGSLEKKDYKPGGGDKKVQTQKLNFKESAHSKVGSKDNLKHKAGGGDIEIPVEKIDFKAKASSKVGSLDNVKHKAGGGDKKIYDDKEYLKQTASTTSNPTSSGRASGAISPATTGTNSPGPQEEDESQSQKDE